MGGAEVCVCVCVRKLRRNRLLCQELCREEQKVTCACVSTESEHEEETGTLWWELKCSTLQRGRGDGEDSVRVCACVCVCVCVTERAGAEVFSSSKMKREKNGRDMAGTKMGHWNRTVSRHWAGNEDLNGWILIPKFA